MFKMNQPHNMNRELSTFTSPEAMRRTKLPTPKFMRCGWTIVIVIFGWVGCSGRPARIDAPTWNPEGMADQAIADLDRNGDGNLSKEELKAAPGLEYCARLIDEKGNSDGSLSRDEIAARIGLYREMKVALVPFDCTVTFNKLPLEGAKVRLVPEPFLGQILEPLESTSNKQGRVEFSAEDIPMSVIPVGIYRVEITSPNVEIPAKYNTKTTLGVEVSAMTDPYHPGRVTFNLQKK